MIRIGTTERTRRPLFALPLAVGLVLAANAASCSLLTPTSDLLGNEPPAGAGGEPGDSGHDASDEDAPADHAIDHAPPGTCGDGLRDGDETDTDCGGSCSRCVDGKKCKGAGDCESGDCLNAVCQAATCTDMLHNGGETDVDCGGGACPPCADGRTCEVPADCVHLLCHGGTCAAATCSDQVRDGLETDVDCGGAKCAKCPDFKSCLVGGDCTSGVCAPDPNMAIPKCQPCADGKLDGTETDVDCGGGLCKPCVLQRMCVVPGDCASGQCQNNRCRAKCGDPCSAVGDCLSSCPCNLTTKKCGK